MLFNLSEMTNCSFIKTFLAIQKYANHRLTQIYICYVTISNMDIFRSWRIFKLFVKFEESLIRIWAWIWRMYQQQEDIRQ